MNERIDKLAEQAGAKVHREQTRSGDWIDFSDYTGFDFQKFAELIVKEAGAYLMSPEFIGRNDLDWSMVLNEHFGVE